MKSRSIAGVGTSAAGPGGFAMPGVAALAAGVDEADDSTRIFAGCGCGGRESLGRAATGAAPLADDPGADVPDADEPGPDSATSDTAAGNPAAGDSAAGDPAASDPAESDDPAANDPAASDSASDPAPGAPGAPDALELDAAAGKSEVGRGLNSGGDSEAVAGGRHESVLMGAAGDSLARFKPSTAGTPADEVRVADGVAGGALELALAPPLSALAAGAVAEVFPEAEVFPVLEPLFSAVPADLAVASA
jgi:hypothetical protein